MSENKIHKANELLRSLMDQYPHYVIQCFSYQGEMMNVELKTTFTDEELDQILLEVEGADAN